MRMISTHRVYRGIEWLPCYCESTFDHNLGSEQWPAAVAWFPTYPSGKIVRNYGDGSAVYASETREQAEQVKRIHLGATGHVVPLFAAISQAISVDDEMVQRAINAHHAVAYQSGKYGDSFEAWHAALEAALHPEQAKDGGVS